MSRRKSVLLLLITLIIVGGTYWSGASDIVDSIRPRRVDAAEIEVEQLFAIPPADEGISLFRKRTIQDPTDAVSLTILGQLYARLAWETEDVTLYGRAEEMLSRSLTLLPNYKPAEASLAAAQLAQHEFERALRLGQKVYEEDPRRVDALATVGDAALALGRYEQAESIYQRLDELAPSPQTLARLAHLAELNGQPDEAIALMHEATMDALDVRQNREQLAWYLFRLGDLYFDGGQLDEASEYLQAALEIRPNYAAALGVLGEVRAAESLYDEAITLHQQALLQSESIATLSALGDLYALTGRPEQAWDYYQAVETQFGHLVVSEPEIYGREMAVYYADHLMKLDQAQQLIEADLERRQDIDAYDAAAWVYYQQGELDKAQAMIEEALRLGTQDAGIIYHAGMIARAQGKTLRATELLAEALAINPSFDAIQANNARATLASLQLSD